MTNDRRAEQLGMPWGTAQNQLRKQVLFKMAKKAGAATCYRCNKDIETAEELSIEHIKPWLDVSVELFWDLENISFSHRDCNRPHRNTCREKTHCPQGHPYNSENTYKYPIKGWRYCKVCKNARQRSSAG